VDTRAGTKQFGSRSLVELLEQLESRLTRLVRPEKRWIAAIEDGKMDERIDDVLDFWFGELDELGRASADRRKLWWTKSDAFDQTIRSRFREDHAAIVAGRRESWRSSPRGALAYIIVLDQLSRNMFRGSAKMFEADELARKACKKGIARGFDTNLAFDELVFFYLPLQHSEEIRDQRLSVDLLAAMLDAAPDGLKDDARYYLDFAERHRAIIERFGRFPHRNEILGRASTPDETEFLREPGSSF
jgi:uncharacterized protein (DUF924 family)